MPPHWHYCMARDIYSLPWWTFKSHKGNNLDCKGQRKNKERFVAFKNLEKGCAFGY